MGGTRSTMLPARRALLARWRHPAIGHQLFRARAITVLTRPHPTNQLLAPQYRAGQPTMLPVSVRSLVTQIDGSATSEQDKSWSGKQLTRVQKLKAMWHNYRWVFAAYYGVLWAAPLFPIWVGLEAGFDGVAALKYMGADTLYSGIDNWNPSIINGLIAIEINSLVDLVRLPLAITTTPKVAAWWRSRGDAETGVKFVSRNKSKQASATPTSRDMSSLTRGPPPPSARKARSEKKKKRKKKR